MVVYVYKITFKLTGQFYYGSRTIKTANKRPEDDLFITYFTSSKVIKSLIKEHGAHEFITDILFTSSSYNETYEFEQTLIKTNIQDPLCVNKHYFDIDQNKTVFSNFGNRHSSEQKEKWSKSRKGKAPSNKGKSYDSDKKRNFRSKNKGKTYDEIYGDRANEIREKIKKSNKERPPIRNETREKLRKVHTLRTPESYKKAGEKNKNRVFLEETLSKMSAAKKGKPAHNKGIATIRASCIKCKKECDVRNLGRHHKH